MGRDTTMIKRIRILYLVDVLRAWGGTEKHLYELISRIDKSRFDCFVCSFGGSDELMDAFARAGATTLHLPLERIYGIRAIRQAGRLLKFIRQNEIDIVQTMHFAADFFGVLVARCARVPVVISSKRDTGFQNTSLQNLALRLIRPLVDRTICVSGAVSATMIAGSVADHEASVVIYNGVDLAEFTVSSLDINQKRAELGLLPDAPVIVMVANLRSIKDVETFIIAAHMVLDVRRNAHFMVIGSPCSGTGGSSYRAGLERLATKLGLNGSLSFRGPRSDINELLAISGVCVLTSLSEGFSNTLLEYMASAKPVVVTDVGGNPEAVVNGETGFLVPPRSPDRIAEHILALLKDTGLASRMGRAGRKRVEELFTIEAMVKSYQSLYAQLLADATGGERPQPRFREFSDNPSSSPKPSRTEAT